MRARPYPLTAAALLMLAAAWPGLSQPRAGSAPPKAMLGDNSAGSRGQPAHVIALRDPEGDTIQPEDRRPLPFSTVQTCGADCHDVATISRGWHFNAALPGVPAGRKGQPWLFIDRATATQIPLSYRAWPGTYNPSQAGLSNRVMALHFGGRMPGGLPPDESGTDHARWAVSGSLEVNCLACHDGSPAYDQAEYARQVSLENFRYAPAAASGLAAVTGSSKEMPAFFDYLLPTSVEDTLQDQIPRLDYARSRFLSNGKVAFDIVRQVKVTRCYYCHSNTDVEETGAARWRAGEDVHLARGIACVQCHRNNLDHQITRGYEGDPAGAKDAFATTLTCRGCHMAGDSGTNTMAERMGAPYPKHAGIPPVHFNKLTCTACHSGPWPAEETRRMKNGLSHGLGEFNVNKSPEALPHIYYPVFAPQEDGKIGPNRLIWPAFWGRLRGGAATPVHAGEVLEVLKKEKLERAPAPDGSWPPVDAEWVARVLRRLNERADTEGPAVYIAGGRLHRLDGAGRLQAEEHPQAQPYLWPLAHDVRPASQSLGVKGCQDCHSADSAFFFGRVAVDSPLAPERAARWTMHRFEKNLDLTYNMRLAGLWPMRSWFKTGGMLAAGLILLLLAAYTLQAMEGMSAAAAGIARKQPGEARGPGSRLFQWSRVAVNAAGLAGFIAIAATGFYSYAAAGAMAGYRLMVHVAAAPVFVAAAVAVVLFWAHRNRFAASHRESSAVRLRKFFFWVAAAVLAPTVVSILLAMYPLAGPHQQEYLFQVHRSCALVFASSAILFAGFALAAWREGSTD
jgi:hypothetical protein